MEELSIKIKIAEREYPMKVHPSEEERVRLAGKLVNEKYKQYRDQFGIDDKQDLLAMVAFEVLVERLRLENDKSITGSALAERISGLETLITGTLSEE